MDRKEIENIEVDLLVEAIYRRYGHDFRDYSKSHMRRRIKQLVSRKGIDFVSGLIPEILHDEAMFENLLYELSITVTQMFRDPSVFRRLRQEVIPLLRTFPFIRVWVAGCATGEEAYSLAILMKEEGLFDRTTIFATDFNDAALEKAKAGVFPIDIVRKYSENYLQAGGAGSFADYYHARYDCAAIAPWLRQHLVFANHNLATDRVFSEMHLVFCRNVLIYFNSELQNRVLGLLTESLVRGGFLCLGPNEDIMFSNVRDFYRRVDEAARIFQLQPAQSFQ